MDHNMKRRAEIAAHKVLHNPNSSKKCKTENGTALTQRATITSYFKENNHIKLKGAAKTKFKNKVFDRDGWQCVDCERRDMLTLSHKIHAGMGGKNGPGDTMDNCVCRCMVCHDEEERHLNGRIKS